MTQAWAFSGMQERAKELGGTLEIKSNGKGTTVIARLPLPRTVKGDEMASAAKAPVIQHIERRRSERVPFPRDAYGLWTIHRKWTVQGRDGDPVNKFSRGTLGLVCERSARTEAITD